MIYRMIWFGHGVKPTGLYRLVQKEFCGGQGVKRPRPWRLALESEWDSCLSGKTDFEEAFTPNFDPGAQHINRGAGLAPGTHQETPSRVPATLSSSLSSVIVSVVLGEALRRLFFTNTVTTPSCCRNSSTTSPLLPDQESEDVIELNVC